MKTVVINEQDLEELRRRARTEFAFDALDYLTKLLEVDEKPRPAIIFCPGCHMQHIDRPDALCLQTSPAFIDQDHPCRLVKGHEGPCKPDPTDEEKAWENPTHRSHTCRKDDGGCGLVFRLTDYPTTGVKNIETRGKADTWAIHIQSTGD